MTLPYFDNKIVWAIDELALKLNTLARPLVFTNGVFDVLHCGHVTYLQKARDLGRSLVVGVNSDASVRMLGKGPDRPINGEAERAVVLASLASTSLVVLFAEKMPANLLKALRPDVYVKGGDYKLTDLPEAALVKSWGGEAKVLPFVNGFSSTSIIAKIRQSNG